MPKTGKTTQESMETRRQGIDFALLPRTLREAIYVACLLGISFIWIDALCIIQGDIDDWTKESAMMSKV